jgi:hypothetical protein
MKLSRKHSVIVGSAIVLVLIACYLLCSKAKADEIKGQFFLPISARYIEDLGVAGGVGYVFPSGLQLSGQISYDRLDAQSITSSCQIRCQTCSTTSVAPAHGQTGFTFTIGIPLGKREAKK